MQISQYAPKLVRGDTLLGQRHTEGSGPFVWLVLAHNIHTCMHTYRDEGRLVRYKNSHGVKIILLSLHFSWNRKAEALGSDSSD